MQENKNQNENKNEDPDLESKEEEKEPEEENFVLGKTKALLFKKLLNNMRDNLDQLLRLMDPLASGGDDSLKMSQLTDEKFNKPEAEEGDVKIIEGMFDGENMIGPDGKVYSVPANYASKSRLIEGDILKLTIVPNGTFIYKQIRPIERIRVVGKLEKEGDVYYVSTDSKRWRVLNASVTYYKGEPGDEAIIIIPRIGESNWAALENIVKIS